MPGFRAWRFVASMRTPTVLLSSLGSLVDVPEPIRRLGDQLFGTMALGHPAFRRAIEPGPRQALALAWASVSMRELCWVCLLGAEPGDAARQAGLLTVIGDVMERFLRDFA